MSDIVINDGNFETYFRDTRKHPPRRGDVLARFAARADFIDGKLKRDLITLLKDQDKALPATKFMRKVGQATEIDSYRICREIVEDILAGLTDDEIASKVYSFNFESFYYTKPEYIPKDPHWEAIAIKNLDEFMDKAGNKLKMNWKFKEPVMENTVS